MMLAMATSCGNTYNSAAVIGVQNPVAETQVVAKVDYANATKVQGFGEEKVLFGFIKWGKNHDCSFKASNRYKGLSISEKRAMFDAVEKSEADIILEPQFKTYTKVGFLSIFRHKKTYMTGWSAKIVGFEEK